MRSFTYVQDDKFANNVNIGSTAILLPFGDKDPVVHFYPLMAELYGKERCRWFNGEHRLNDKVVDKVLLPLIKEMVASDVKGEWLKVKG